ncbi:MAG: hypothetical protein JOZ54_07690, partial [Acidobacteria bacterium]|nr:hypothetical protein [Acidobacteriota bacterium]
MRARLLLALMLLLAPRAFAAEVPLSDVVESGLEGSQHPFAIASDGTDYLFVWRGEGYWQSAAARVSHDGTVLDRKAIALPSGVDYVAWTGKFYQILWNEPDTAGRYHIRGMRIGSTETLLGTVDTIKQDAFAVACATNGKHVVIVYGSDNMTKRSALFLDADGRIVADVLLTSTGTPLWFDLAWNGTHFAALWMDDTGPNTFQVQGLRFTSAGRLDPAPRVLYEGTMISRFDRDLKLVSHGDEFMVSTSADGETSTRRLSSDLSSVAAAHPLPRLRYARPIWNGSELILLAARGDAILALHLDRDGVPVREQVVLNNRAFNVVAASNSDEIIIAWDQVLSACTGDYDVHGSAVSASALAPRFQTRVTVAPENQRHPIVGSSGANLLAMWQAGSAVYARRLRPDGSALDAAPLLVAECGSPRAIVFNGLDYIVFWSLSPDGSYGIGTARVPVDGPLRAERAKDLAGFFATAASNGSTTLLVWRSPTGLRASRLGSDGAELDSIPLTLAGSYPVHDFAVAGSNSDFLLVWAEDGPATTFTDPCCRPTNKVRGARISTELLNRDPG